MGWGWERGDIEIEEKFFTFLPEELKFMLA